MQNIWYLVCISVWITSGYADITNLNDVILVAISHLSENINSQFSNVNNKVDKLQKKIENMEGQLSSIEVAADAANEKASFILPDVNKIVNSVGDMTVSIDSVVNDLKVLTKNISFIEKEQDNKIINNFEEINFTLHSLGTDLNELKVLRKNISENEKEQCNKILNTFEGMNFTLHSLETDLNELKVLRKNISLTEKEQDDRIMNNFEGVNITLGSLESKLEGVFENMSLIEKEQERKIVNNFQNVNGEIGSVKNKIDELGRNLSAIAMQQEKKIVNIQKRLTRHKSCSDIYNQGSRTSETVKIFPYIGHPDDSVSVICDQVSDGGRWTVIQRCQDVQPRENFTRPWADYVQGFGKLDGEFWVGLKVIQGLTHQGSHELHISLEDWEGNKRYAKYSHFFVGPPEDNYRLKVTGYSGDAGDGLNFHNGQAFSTYDQDNDKWSRNCARDEGKGGWWYNVCSHGKLNGLPVRGDTSEHAIGIIWSPWRGWGYSLKSVTMKIRPIN